ncbi:hypothetical protein OUZ56_028843 [Daphnia magna]|uniref:Uncharacterized protein n=1 Tax=Daphnia magna TaxID=35525 RepID=A0ABR0B535_9CRUS|nr:hypothetical protein OUZ56_028843 [Daphnia magna]
MTTTPDRVQVPGLNLQQEIGSSIRYTSATCLSHSVATPSLMGIRVVEPVSKPDIITGRKWVAFDEGYRYLFSAKNYGGGGYPIPVKPYRPKQKIVNRFTTLVKFFNAIILHKWIDLINSYPFLAYGLPIIIHSVPDPSNHTDKNIQSVYYSVRPNMVTYKAILILCTGIEGLPETR